MKLSVSAYRAHASAHKKILSSGYHSQLNYGSTGAAAASSSSSAAIMAATATTSSMAASAASGIYGHMDPNSRLECNSDTDIISPTGTSSSGGNSGVGGAADPTDHGGGGASGGGGHHHHQHHHHHHQHQHTKRSHKTATGNGGGRENGDECGDDDNNSNAHSSDSKSPSQRKSRIGDGASDPDSDWTRSNQRWMKLRTTVQISSAIQKKPPLKREDSFLKRFSTRQIPETQETVEDTGSESASGDVEKSVKRRRRYLQKRRSVVNPDENFYFYWLMMLTVCVLYNLWTLIVRQSFPELQEAVPTFWLICDILTDIVFVLDIVVQLRTGYLEQGLMVYDDKKLACHYVHSRDFIFDMIALIPLDLLQLKMGTQPLLRFTRFFKVYRSVRFYYIVESRTVWPNLWRVVNLIHILLILAHWFGCFYYLLSEAEGFQGDWVYPYRPGDYATLTRKYLGSLYWSTLTLTTIGDLPTPETNAEPNFSVDGPRSIPRRGIKSRLLQFGSSYGYVFTIVSYLIGVFIFATIVGQVGNVITNRNANRLEFERLLDGAKTYMRHHKVPGGMKRRVLRWYDYSWSRGRIQGGGDINTALGLLPDKLKTELALHVNLSVLKKVTIFQECQPEFLHDLVLKMKAYIFTPGDSICRKGEVAREMFIIADGILEVLSETGKVLTTMKAGDFFGEIGILNLDGLNKRTADVRSVGYSELFSLSREDVLAAMKDYPDAQEILQTLGRKRLMEVRCVNKKYAKAQSDKDAAFAAAAAAAAQHQQGGHGVHQSDSSENSASKKIVDKLKHDVKGFRNVLKKSRTSRKNDESMEMQPLHNSSPRGSKTMLKRMSRVRSDEKDDSAEAKDELHDKTPSPIGAGLPLLQRLRLLKEKQDREERAVKSTTTPQKSPPHSHVTCTLSPQESIQEEPEREFNEGFPLIQRLQQLKIKNEPQANDSGAMAQATTTPLTISSKVDTHFMGGTCSGANLLANVATAAATSTISSSLTSSSVQHSQQQSLTIAQIKPIMKVSFKQKIQQLQSGGAAAAAAPAPAPILGCSSGGTTGSSSSAQNTTTGAIVKKEPPKSLPVVTKHTAQKPITTISKKVIKPSYRITPMPSDTDTTDSTTPIKPWSKLKLATLISSSYTSLTNCSPDDINTPLKNYSLGSIPHTIIATEQGGVDDDDNVGNTTKAILFKTFKSGSANGNGNGSENGSGRRSSTQHRTKSVSTRLNNKSGSQSKDAAIGSSKSAHTKLYRSVFDLSPEYCGLPFVKRLKILNERQKLAELERALQTRSFSLDSSKMNNSEEPISESLYRCYSDTSGIYSQFMTTYESTASSTTSTTTTSTSDKYTKQHQQQHPHSQQQHQLESVQQEYVPLSPESNETTERRKLKSILKKLHQHKSRETLSTSTPTSTTASPSITGLGTGIGIGIDIGIDSVGVVGGAIQDHEGLENAAATNGASISGINAQRGLLMEPTLEGPPGSAKVCGGHEESFCAFSERTTESSSSFLSAAAISPPASGLGSSGYTLNETQVSLIKPNVNANSGNGNGRTAAASGILMQPKKDSTATPWSPTTLTMRRTTVTPTNSPQDAAVCFSFNQQHGGDDIHSTGSGSGSGNGGVTTYANYTNNILSSTDFHAQSCTDVNLNLQLRQHSNSSSTMSQVPQIEGGVGIPQTQEYFNQILCGINDVIKTHMNDMHSKFELQFTNMASEVRRRDAIIQQLQLKLRNIETKSQGIATLRRRNRDRDRITLDDIDLELERDRGHHQENSSSGSSAELLFMRGDSLDTVFMSSPPIQGDRRHSISPGTSKHGMTASTANSATSIYGSQLHMNYPASGSTPSTGVGTGTTQFQHGNSSGSRASSSVKSSGNRIRDWALEGARRVAGSSSMGGGGAVIVSDITGNLTCISDSVILDIGESSSSSSSSCKLNISESPKVVGGDGGGRGGDDDDDQDDEDEGEIVDDDDDGVAEESANRQQQHQVHHNDWEVRMLAAEMERQERRRGHSLSDDLGDLKHCSSFLRRRRKFSDTETECSETDFDEMGPNGASSSGATMQRLQATTVPTSGQASASSSSASAQIPAPTTRPRASSLDQFNLRYGIGRGIFKAMSIDRDKDKL